MSRSDPTRQELADDAVDTYRELDEAYWARQDRLADYTPAPDPWGTKVTFTAYVPGAPPSDSDVFRATMEIDALIGASRVAVESSSQQWEPRDD